MEFVVGAVLADIAARTDCDVKLPAIAAGDDVARPVVVVAARRQIENLLSFAVDVGGAPAVGVAPYAVGVGT
jgi:hypothetical protein